MADQFKKFVIEVRPHLVEGIDQPIHVFCLNIQNDHGVWDETCSEAELKVALRFLSAGINMAGGPHASFAWNVLGHWRNIPRKRWTLEDGVFFKEEDLDKDGNIIEI